MDLMEQLRIAMVELEEDAALQHADEALANGVSSIALLQVCEHAMRLIGERYERGDYSLSGLILAGEIFREVLERAQPGLEVELSGEGGGKVLVGTVAGDIHDLGKNILVTALRGFGFTVMDLGVDVPPERFVEAALEFRPDVVGLSGLVSPAYKSMKVTADLLRAHATELGYVPSVVLGGGAIDEEARAYVAADSWTNNAMEGVRICQKLIGERAERQAG